MLSQSLWTFVLAKNMEKRWRQDRRSLILVGFMGAGLIDFEEKIVVLVLVGCIEGLFSWVKTFDLAFVG